MFHDYLVGAALIRHNKAATNAFRLSNGYAGLRGALSSEDPRFQRYYITSSAV